jgi:molybdopterin converting factor small subunit
LTIEVLLFGSLRELGDGRALRLDVPEGATVKAARAALAARLEAERPGRNARALVERAAFATEEDVLDDAAAVPAGVSLAVLPPVCGG